MESEPGWIAPDDGDRQQACSAFTRAASHGTRGGPSVVVPSIVVSFRSPFENYQRIQRMLDLMMGRSSILRVLENQERIRRLVEAQSAATRATESHRRIQELMTGSQSVLSRLEGPTLFSRVDAAARAVERNQKLLDAISQRSAFTAMLGVNDSVAALARQQQFTSLVAQAMMPTDALKAALGQLRDPIGVELYESAVEEFDRAAAEIALGGGIWWIERLPITGQLALLVVLLQVLDKMSLVAQDATGVHLPAVYRSATEAVFALVVGILAVVDARTKALSDDDARSK
jgi:hypothetical protein